MSDVESVGRRVLVVCSNLFFSARIVEVARSIGVVVEVVDAPAALVAAHSGRWDLMIVDLETSGDPIVLVEQASVDRATRPSTIVAFYPHVRDELRRAALAAGADQVVPRSAFVQRLPELLAGRGLAR